MKHIVIARTGAINQPVVLRTTSAWRDTQRGRRISRWTGLPAVAAPLLAAGEKLYFTNNLRTDYFEYTIKSLERPGWHHPSTRSRWKIPGWCST